MTKERENMATTVEVLRDEHKLLHLEQTSLHEKAVSKVFSVCECMFVCLLHTYKLLMWALMSNNTYIVYRLVERATG